MCASDGVTTTTAPHRWRSPALGCCRALDLDAGRVEYFEQGEGPTIVFAHGWLANANLWRKVVAALADRFRCVVLDLPLGSHRLAMSAETDLSPVGCGKLIARAIEMLDLEGVTLVGNDSGGAYSQIAAATHPERIARLVLNSCETPFDEFPPPPFDGLPAVASDTAALGRLFAALRDREVRASPAAYGLLMKHSIDDLVSDSYALPSVLDDDVLRDTGKVMSSASSRPVHEAGERLIKSFDRPVLFAWGTEDQVFPLAHARRYADALADGSVTPIPDAFSFTPEDQPGLLAEAVAEFCGGRASTV